MTGPVKLSRKELAAVIDHTLLTPEATTSAVALMAAAVRPRLGVKAAGGIRSAADALAMIGAGATRLGLSRSAAILADLGDDAA